MRQALPTLRVFISGIAGETYKPAAYRNDLSLPDAPYNSTSCSVQPCWQKKKEYAILLVPRSFFS